jgi:hypothetical protein
VGSGSGVPANCGRLKRNNEWLVRVWKIPKTQVQVKQARLLPRISESRCAWGISTKRKEDKR